MCLPTEDGAMSEHESHSPHEHRPRDTPHEARLSRDQLDEEVWFEEQGEEMTERLDDLEHEIEDADREAHTPLHDPLTESHAGDDEIAGGHHRSATD
jgi:hypothetical protein